MEVRNERIEKYLNSEAGKKFLQNPIIVQEQKEKEIVLEIYQILKDKDLKFAETISILDKVGLYIKRNTRI